MEELIEQVKKLHARLKGSRHNWDSHWEEIAHYVFPRKDDVFTQKDKVGGEKKSNNQNLYDSTAIHANELLASALHGMLTNPTAQWFDLAVGAKEIDEDEEVKGWIQDIVKRIHQILNNSNFQTEIHELFLDLCSFGTGAMRIEDDPELIIRFNSRPIYELQIKENSKGSVDLVSREYKMSGRQILQEFGKKVFDAQSLMNLERDGLKEWNIIHMVQPSKDIPNRKMRRKKFTSTHVLCEMDVMLKLAGFHEFPYVIPRWSKVSGELYGRSPAMKSLPDIKMINEVMKATIRSAQKMVDPPLQVPDDGVLLPLRTSPGSLNYYRAGTKDRIEPIITGGRPDLGFQLMEQLKLQIRQSFFIDQLQLNEGPQMTATEVIQRSEEKLRLLGPLLGRLHFELLQPMIDRIFGMLIRNGEISPETIPALLEGKQLEVKFSSMIARAQKTSEVENLNRAMQSIGPMIEIDPSVADNFDGDEIVRFVADRFDLPVNLLKKEKERDAIREQRAQQQQQQMEQEQNLANAEVINKAGPALEQ